MSGLWLENGMHYSITYEYALEIADKLRKDGRVIMGDTEVRMVLPTKPGKPIKLNQGKILLSNRRSK